MILDVTLEEFVQAWLRSPVIRPPGPWERPVVIDGSLSGVVLFREGPFQVQLLIIAPGSEIPDHVHPNVDSYEVYFSGEIAFRKHGEYLTKPDWSDALEQMGSLVEVRHTDSHGGSFGGVGGCFLSIQKWRNGVRPTNVGDDWAYVGGGVSARCAVNG